MISAGTDTCVFTDLGPHKPGKKLQRRDSAQDWKNYLVNRRVVKSPIEIEALPPGEYRLK